MLTVGLLTLSHPKGPITRARSSFGPQNLLSSKPASEVKYATAFGYLLQFVHEAACLQVAKLTGDLFNRQGQVHGL